VKKSSSLGENFLDFIEPVYSKCISFIERETIKISKNDHFELDLIVTNIEFLNGLFESIGSSLTPYVAQSQLIPCVNELIKYIEIPEIQQALFAIIGELCRCSLELIRDNIPNYVQLLLLNIEKI